MLRVVKVDPTVSFVVLRVVEVDPTACGAKFNCLYSVSRSDNVVIFDRSLV